MAIDSGLFKVKLQRPSGGCACDALNGPAGFLTTHLQAGSSGCDDKLVSQAPILLVGRKRAESETADAAPENGELLGDKRPPIRPR